MIYLTLICEFFLVGLFSIGGGMTALKFLEKLSDKYDWYSKAMLVDMIAVSESTPGPIGINMATYAGFEAAGILGGIVGTFAMIMPSIIIMVVLVKVLDTFKTNKHVSHTFYGLRPAVTALVASAAVSIMGVTVIDLANWPHFTRLFDFKLIGLLAALLVVSWRFKKLLPVHLIVIAAVAGIILKC